MVPTDDVPVLVNGAFGEDMALLHLSSLSLMRKMKRNLSVSCNVSPFRFGG
jgi:hypothetical protein